jgi:hypothetical protein
MENHLDIKENNNSVTLTHYASGDGSLSLCFKKRYFGSDDASAVKVSYRDVEAYMKKAGLEDWKIHKLATGVYTLYQTMERLSPDEILFKNKIYYYFKNPLITAWNDYTIFTEDVDGKRVEVKNMNIKAGISYWLNHIDRGL